MLDGGERGVKFIASWGLCLEEQSKSDFPFHLTSSFAQILWLQVLGWWCFRLLKQPSPLSYPLCYKSPLLHMSQWVVFCPRACTLLYMWPRRDLTHWWPIDTHHAWSRILTQAELWHVTDPLIQPLSRCLVHLIARMVRKLKALLEASCTQ